MRLCNGNCEATHAHRNLRASDVYLAFSCCIACQHTTELVTHSQPKIGLHQHSDERTALTFIADSIDRSILSISLFVISTSIFCALVLVAPIFKLKERTGCRISEILSLESIT